MPHRRRMWTVQWYSPGCANVHPTHAPLGLPVFKSQRYLDRFSHFCTARGRAYVGLLHNGPPFPLKIAPFHGDLNPILNMVPWDHASPQAKRHVDRFSRFCRAHYCDRPTDRQTTLLGI